ncbi:GNAT family N-acetyltransferase [Oceanirhabdus sp. W0125-5]|uniref:GNAT family N-acetyltransferase n=1 Tax=Oceanirhabdus sp. W0125-5 TaxID=2999116 RepID=UPI0022F2D230|nr:GNAT family N-acetyltransferase [Oceanirhabdus sp. W0125-5]WBW94923.1 GNAT family N-acetyltransferase [Oceanirhabdus sp. W0125-5]
MVIKTEKSKAIKEFLEKDLLINLNMLGIIENVPEAEIYIDNVENPKGVFIKKDYFNYIYSKEDSFIDEVCDNFIKDGYYGFSGVEETIAKKIQEKYQVHWENPCYLYYMPKENLNLELIKNEVQNVDIKDAEIIDEFYEFRNPGSIDAIKKDIENRPSSALYINDEIVCWVLTHDDNSMGIMYTKEEHRRKGYAVDTAVDLAHKTLEIGRIPYLQIVTRNKKSPGLAKKCGFVEMGIVSWFGIIAGTPKEVID